MPTTTSLQAKLLRPGLRDIFGITMKDWDEEYSKIFDDERSTMSYEDYQELAGLGLIPEQSQGSNVTYDDFMNGVTSQAVNVAYGLGYQITREMIDDNQYRLAKEFPKALARSVKLTIETNAANILNNGFSNTYTYGDGLELFSDAHTTPAGGTYRNEPASQADLAATSLEQSFIDIAAMKDGRGYTMAVRPKKLIVTTSDMYEASILTGSDKSPENANNAINPVKANSLLPGGYTVNHYLTNADAWFIRTDQEGIICQKRIWPAEFRDDNDFDSLNIKQAVYFRMVFYVWNPRSIYGTPGA